MPSHNQTDAPIDQLAALQELDRRLREKTELMQTLEREVSELEGQRLLQVEATRVAHAEREAVEARRRDLEGRLEADEAKMTDRRMRLNRVRNEKELQALRREIEVGKEANQLTEEELLGVFESLDALKTAAAEAERRLAELEEGSTGKIAERRARIGEFAAELKRERESRDRTAASLDGNVRQKYEQILTRRGGTAVVEVRNGTCLGCHMNLPPQVFNELQRTRDIRLCPNCHRILFWRPERLEQIETPR